MFETCESKTNLFNWQYQSLERFLAFEYCKGATLYYGHTKNEQEVVPFIPS